MSTSVNEVRLLGRLGRNPEIRHTGGGAGVANMTLATDESYKDKTSGEKVTKTEWHRLVSWISIPFIEKYLHSGDMIYVSGKLQTREWTDKTSNAKKSVTEINVLDIKPVITARVDGTAAPATRSTAKPAAHATARPATRPAPAQDEYDSSDAPPMEISDEDIPF